MPESPRITRVIFWIGLALLTGLAIILFQPPKVLALILNSHLVQSINLLSILLTSATALLVLLGAWFLMRAARENYFLAKAPLLEVQANCHGQHWIKETRSLPAIQDFLTDVHRELVIDGHLDSPFESILTLVQFAVNKSLPDYYVRDLFLEQASLCLPSNQDYELTLKALATTSDKQIPIESLRAVQLGLIIRAGYRPRSEDLEYLWLHVLSIQEGYNYLYPDTWTEERKSGIVDTWVDILPEKYGFMLKGISKDASLKQIRDTIRRLVKRGFDA